MSVDAPSVQVVVVNYRTPALAIECLRSLEPQVRARPGTTVVVVDNASGDDSVPRIGAAIGEANWSWATLLPSSVNGGFAAGNNLAIQKAMASPTPPDVFWLLNPDTVAEPGALDALVAFFVAHPAAGICGGRLIEADGTPWRVALRFPGILNELERGCSFGPVSRLLRRWAVLQPIGDTPVRTEWVSGASMAVRRAVFDRVGLLDEGYFLYYEETDFCLRAHRAGIECWQEPRSRVVHIAGQSTEVTVKTAQPKRVPAYWFESRRRYFAKNHGRACAALADVAWIAGHCFARLRRCLQRAPAALPPRLLTDFLRHSSLWCSHERARSVTVAKAGASPRVNP